MSSLAKAIASFSKTKFNCFNVDTGCMTEAATVVQRLWETASYDISAQADCSAGTVWCVSDLLGAVNALAEASTSLQQRCCTLCIDPLPCCPFPALTPTWSRPYLDEWVDTDVRPRARALRAKIARRQYSVARCRSI
jgi:hypothetical protein